MDSLSCKRSSTSPNHQFTLSGPIKLDSGESDLWHMIQVLHQPRTAPGAFWRCFGTEDSAEFLLGILHFFFEMFENELLGFEKVAIIGSKTESNYALSLSNQPIHCRGSLHKNFLPLFRIARATKQHSLAMSTNFKCSKKNTSRLKFRRPPLFPTCSSSCTFPRKSSFPPFRAKGKVSCATEHLIHFYGSQWYSRELTVDLIARSTPSFSMVSELFIFSYTMLWPHLHVSGVWYPSCYPLPEKSINNLVGLRCDIRHGKTKGLYTFVHFET